MTDNYLDVLDEFEIVCHLNKGKPILGNGSHPFIKLLKTIFWIGSVFDRMVFCSWGWAMSLTRHNWRLQLYHPYCRYFLHCDFMQQVPFFMLMAICLEFTYWLRKQSFVYIWSTMSSTQWWTGTLEQLDYYYYYYYYGHISSSCFLARLQPCNPT